MESQMVWSQLNKRFVKRSDWNCNHAYRSKVIGHMCKHGHVVAGDGTCPCKDWTPNAWTINKEVTK